MFLALVGCGFVGSTYYDVLKEQHDIYVIDPTKNNNKISDHETYDGIILCLPTPSDIDGSCDFSAIYDVMKDVANPHVPVLIKSTISIEAWRFLHENFANPFTFSPEFLRQEHARRDLEENKRVIFAGNCRNAGFWWEVYSACDIFKRKQYSYISSAEEIIIAKYAINSFLATKVSWFNQLYDFCIDNELSYDTVRSAVCDDPRIGQSHSEVTKERAWGGACFPKDTSAFLHMDKKNSLTLLENAVQYNKELKPR